MDIGEIMDHMQELLDTLEKVGDQHPDHAATQRLVAHGAFEGAKGMKRLNMLLLYKETEGGSNGDEPAT